MNRVAHSSSAIPLIRRGVIVPPWAVRIIIRVRKARVGRSGARKPIECKSFRLAVDKNDIVVDGEPLGTRTRRVGLLPNYLCHEVRSPKYLVHEDAHTVVFDVVKVDPDRAVVGEQLTQVNEAVAHHGQPDGVLEIVLVVGKRLGGVKRGVDVDAFDLADVFFR
ncbi:hypothetical protein B840_12520 (plasmid) [Corynebacterium marinum DSM 44953]|uniref:Uncharacterized protein n=1 Tax=Corynebacterium marinum DSM 44953 TaxID=1224162 RepID=A0A0B6TJD2_9CORY|nr:hypothetical protein B840_12520 [Corynebacterium marinum DSM 44953]